MDFSHFPEHILSKNRSTFGKWCYDWDRKLRPLRQTSKQCTSSLVPSMLQQQVFKKTKNCTCQYQLFSLLGRFPVRSHAGISDHLQSRTLIGWGVVQRLRSEWSTEVYFWGSSLKILTVRVQWVGGTAVRSTALCLPPNIKAVGKGWRNPPDGGIMMRNTNLKSTAVVKGSVGTVRETEEQCIMSATLSCPQILQEKNALKDLRASDFWQNTTNPPTSSVVHTKNVLAYLWGWR